jgi:hypothetical protein
MIQKTQIRCAQKHEFVPVYTKKLCEEVEVEIHAFSTSALDEGGSLFHVIAAIPLVRGLQHPLSRWLARCPSKSVEIRRERCFVTAGIEPRSIGRPSNILVITQSKAPQNVCCLCKKVKNVK